MEKASIHTMELCNAIFGNSRGSYSIVPRMDYQEAFYSNFLAKIGSDGYGNPENFKMFGLDSYAKLEALYDNDTFVIRPYYWGDDEKIAALPNFVFKPKGIEISWYKYPMRDAYCSEDMTLDEFNAMLEECVKAFNELVKGATSNEENSDTV